MIKVHVTKQANYPVSTPKLKKRLVEFFIKEGIVSDADVNVAIVGTVKMLTLAKKYLNENGVVHNVLTFADNEVKEKFIAPPSKILHLGEIVICYPKIIAEAKDEGSFVEEKVFELAEHGALHLMGKHHE